MRGWVWLAFGGDPPTLVALGEDESVWVWNGVTGGMVKTITLADRPKSVSCMAFSPDSKVIASGGKYLAAGYADGTINVWKKQE